MTDDILEVKALKEQLEKEIIEQSSAITELNKQLNYCRHVSNPSSISIKNKNTSINLKNDLYRFAGMHCVKFDNPIVIEFSAGDKVASNSLFSIEILQTDDQYKLGKWVMPMSIDLNNILSKYSLDSPKNLKKLLKSCKHYIDCYIYRRKQYYDLKVMYNRNFSSIYYLVNNYESNGSHSMVLMVLIQGTLTYERNVYIFVFRIFLKM